MQKPIVDSPSVSALVAMLDGLYEAAKARYEAHVRAAGDVPEGADIDWKAPEVKAQVGTLMMISAGLFGAEPVTVTGNVWKFTSEANDAGAKPSNSVVVTGFQLVEALNFFAPDSTREQLTRDVVIEYRDKSPENPEGGLYAYDLEYPEEGSIPLEGAEVDVFIPEGQFDWVIYIGYLLDKCEGQEVSEESLQHWLADMVKDPNYGPQFRREVGPHKCPLPMPFEAAFEEGRKLIEEIAEHFAACEYDELCARLDVYLKANPVPGDTGQAAEVGDDE
ncbi:hypothetical protein ACR3H8_20160 [Pseudomonas aeruginosa]|uniref:hypothetical protein n=1 Tax=Pseudomonas aeruginosa TaxID=287 RepID=UPI000E32501E|nr:hypothetical protein [Pseudomonas aeruginosa]MCC0301132.1 hypothetical protein [Pseudomonas aeruginosa]MCC0408531.1 hypothetical protein [Pseudomonas aeruginosa]MCC0433673.1 hypothetical protein [Pseudomonas aeruginosa]MCR3806705.1 hypothetical protein [Pseudomonas aeruginosa]MCT5450513.1 hypothetical protein [Pseudomonas aeruginosa]